MSRDLFVGFWIGVGSLSLALTLWSVLVPRIVHFFDRFDTRRRLRDHCPDCNLRRSDAP